LLRGLSSEHHQALVLARRIAQAGRSAGADARLVDEVLGSMRDQLEPHFAVEERSLLPALAAVGETALVERTLADHRHLRELAAHLAAPGALPAFGRQLAAHVRFEERELFEVCQQRLDGLDQNDLPPAPAGASACRDPGREA
jgi:hypothetical protein